MKIEITSIIVSIITSIIVSIIISIIGFLYKRNTEHTTLIKNFRLKLAQKHNEGKIVTNKEKQSNLKLKNVDTLKYINVVDINTYIPTLSQNDIDIFFNSLDELNKHKLIFFKKYYIKLTDNLNRFKNCNTNEKFNLYMLDHIIKELENKISFLDIIKLKIKKYEKSIFRRYL